MNPIRWHDDKYARIVLGLPAREFKKVWPDRMYAIADELERIDADARLNGRVFHEQHLIQLAVKMARGPSQSS